MNVLEINIRHFLDPSYYSGTGGWVGVLLIGDHYHKPLQAKATLMMMNILSVWTLGPS